MAIETTLTQIIRVQAKIKELEEGAQALSGHGRSVSYPALDPLYKREEKLLDKYRVEQGTGGPAINYSVPRRDY